MTLTAASGDHSRSLFATPAIVADRRADGSILVKSTMPLQPGARCIGDWLEHWARQAPDRIFLADRAKRRCAVVDRHLQGRAASRCARRPPGSSRKG